MVFIVEQFISENSWKYAKSMPRFPHEYIVKANTDKDKFEQFVLLIREKGTKRFFFSKELIYLKIGEYEYWTMGNPLEQTIIINRAKWK